MNHAGPVAIWQSRLDVDNDGTHYTRDVPAALTANREYWLQVNGVRGMPAIAVRGVDNFAFYRGERARADAFVDVFAPRGPRASELTPGSWTEKSDPTLGGQLYVCDEFAQSGAA